MTTKSHSRPSAECALSTATASASGRCIARRRRLVPAALTWSTRPDSDAPAVRVTYCSATSNSAVTASRSRSACAPAAPPRSLAASQRRCRPERCQACHSVYRGSWPLVDTASRRVEHRLDAPQRTRQFGGEPFGSAVEGLDEQIREIRAAAGSRQRGAVRVAADAATPDRPGRSARSRVRAPGRRRAPARSFRGPSAGPAPLAARPAAQLGCGSRLEPRRRPASAQGAHPAAGPSAR